MEGRMPVRPNGEKHPATVIANAVLVGRIATYETEEVRLDEGKRRAGRMGGKARATAMSTERRRELASEAAANRWASRRETT